MTGVIKVLTLETFVTAEVTVKWKKTLCLVFHSISMFYFVFK